MRIWFTLTMHETMIEFLLKPMMWENEWMRNTTDWVSYWSATLQRRRFHPAFKSQQSVLEGKSLACPLSITQILSDGAREHNECRLWPNIQSASEFSQWDSMHHYEPQKPDRLFIITNVEDAWKITEGLQGY